MEPSDDETAASAPSSPVEKPVISPEDRAKALELLALKPKRVLKLTDEERERRRAHMNVVRGKRLVYDQVRSEERAKQKAEAAEAKREAARIQRETKDPILTTPMLSIEQVQQLLKKPRKPGSGRPKGSKTRAPPPSPEYEPQPAYEPEPVYQPVYEPAYVPPHRHVGGKPIRWI